MPLSPTRRCPRRSRKLEPCWKLQAKVHVSSWFFIRLIYLIKYLYFISFISNVNWRSFRAEIGEVWVFSKIALCSYFALSRNVYFQWYNNDENRIEIVILWMCTACEYTLQSYNIYTGYDHVSQLMKILSTIFPSLFKIALRNFSFISKIFHGNHQTNYSRYKSFANSKMSPWLLEHAPELQQNLHSARFLWTSLQLKREEGVRFAAATSCI